MVRNVSTRLLRRMRVKRDDELPSTVLPTRHPLALIFMLTLLVLALILYFYDFYMTATYSDDMSRYENKFVGWMVAQHVAAGLATSLMTALFLFVTIDQLLNSKFFAGLRDVVLNPEVVEKIPAAAVGGCSNDNGPPTKKQFG